MKTATECYQCKKEVDIIGSDEGTNYYAEKDGREHICENGTLKGRPKKVVDSKIKFN